MPIKKKKESGYTLNDVAALVAAPGIDYQGLNKNVGVLLSEISKNIETAFVKDGHANLLTLAAKQRPTIALSEITLGPRITVPYKQDVDSIQSAGFNMYNILGHALKVMVQTDALTLPSEKVKDHTEAKFVVALRKELEEADIPDTELENMMEAIFNSEENGQFSKEDFDNRLNSELQNFEQILLRYLRHVLGDAVQGVATTFREIVDEPESVAGVAARNVLLRVGDVADFAMGFLNNSNLLGKRAGFFQDIMFYMSDNLFHILFRNHPDVLAIVKMALSVIQRAEQIDPTFMEVFKQPNSLNIERTARVFLQALKNDTA